MISEKLRKNNRVPLFSRQLSLTGQSSMGFTLIEVLIATIILSFGLLFVIESMSRTDQAFRVSQNLVLASQIAENQIVSAEVDAKQSFRGLDTGTDSDDIQFPGKQFKWERVVRPYSHASVRDQRRINQVDVQVNWSEGRDRKNNLMVTSLSINPELKK